MVLLSNAGKYSNTMNKLTSLNERRQALVSHFKKNDITYEMNDKYFSYEGYYTWHIANIDTHLSLTSQCNAIDNNCNH